MLVHSKRWHSLLPPQALNTKVNGKKIDFTGRDLVDSLMAMFTLDRTFAGSGKDWADVISQMETCM